jgi:hypothetical protein
MRYKAKSVAALQLALGSLPDEMQVEVDPEIEVSAKTVGDLARWRHGVRILPVITPIGSDPQSPVRVSGEDDAERHEPPKEDVLEGIERMPESFSAAVARQELRQANREDPLKLVPPA